MAVRFACPGCRRDLTVSERFLGLRIRCPGCWNPLDVPAPANGAPPSPPAGPSGDTAMALKRCPFCSEAILADARKCRYCGELLDRDLAVRKEKERIERMKRRESALRDKPWNVWASLICSLVSILPVVGIPFLAPVLGMVAILTGVAGLHEIRENPRLKGRQLAVTGIVLGTAALIGSVVVIYLWSTDRLTLR